jgi:hypothetical protein
VAVHAVFFGVDVRPVQCGLNRPKVNTKKRKYINIIILIINLLPVSIHELIFNICLQVAYTATKDNPRVFILLF